MKILALNGSHRGQKGCIQWLLDKLAEGALGAGAEFETIVLAEHHIERCTGCEACHAPGQHLHCIYQNEDDVQSIFDRMKAADILIYATPVYIFSMSGLMKTFLDRFNSTAGSNELCVTKSGLFFHNIDKAIYSKPFVVLTGCGNVEAETVRNVISYFQTFSRFLDAPIVGTLARKSIGMMEAARTESLEQKPVILDVVKAYVQAGRELATLGKITNKTQKRANQHILGVPFLNLFMKFPFLKRMVIKREGQKAKGVHNKC